MKRHEDPERDPASEARDDWAVTEFPDDPGDTEFLRTPQQPTPQQP